MHRQPSIFKYRSMWPMFVEPRECIRPQKKKKNNMTTRNWKENNNKTMVGMLAIHAMLYSNIAQCGLCLFSQTSALEPQKRNCGGFAGYCYSSAVRTITITTSSQSSVYATAKQYNCWIIELLGALGLQEEQARTSRRSKSKLACRVTRANKVIRATWATRTIRATKARGPQIPPSPPQTPPRHPPDTHHTTSRQPPRHQQQQ